MKLSNPAPAPQPRGLQASVSMLAFISIKDEKVGPDSVGDSLADYTATDWMEKTKF